jgi:cytoskeleton protein RodZ
MAEDNRQPAPVPPSTPEKRSVGETLKAARSAQSLTLEQIATELRIELPQLEALEGDHFERIGVPVFVKGYLRQYGTRLGLDPRDLLAQYYQQNSLKEVLVQPSKTIKLHDERQITFWVIAALAILVVIVGLAAWWVGAGGSGIASVPSTAPTGGDAKPVPAAPTPRAPEPVTPQPTGGSAGGSAAPPVEAAPSSAPSPPAATPAPSGGAAVPSGTTTLAVATPPPSGRGSADRARPTSPLPSATPAAAAPTAVPPAAASSAAETKSDDGGGRSLVVPLELTFDQESWAEVTDARGERIYYGLGTAGKHAQMRGEPPFAVVLGNAAGVKIVVDGEDFAVPAKGKPGEYARFSVNVVSD